MKSLWNPKNLELSIILNPLLRIQWGIPQESVLRPLLFNPRINDIFHCTIYHTPRVSGNVLTILKI